MKKGSIKNNRINGEVLRALTEIISEEVKDPDVDPLLTVTRVEVTPDLQYCKCGVSSLGTGEELERSVEGLMRAKGFIRTELAHRVNLRKTPEITFYADRSMEYAIEMSKKIDELLKGAGYEESETEV
ncbi:MAG: 30S ribosome-binding factor RbfA [Eubacteriales bacterium]|nr:30S ribosome-binding factor RbfA [Eubacteriales bacterium]